MNRWSNISAILILMMLACPDDSRGEVPEIPKNLKPGEYIKNIIPMRQRVQIMERAWRWKKEHVLPMVMREQNIDMWIVRNNEADLYYNNEGPVYTSLLPANFEGLALPSTYASGVSQTLPGFDDVLRHGRKHRICRAP